MPYKNKKSKKKNHDIFTSYRRNLRKRQRLQEELKNLNTDIDKEEKDIIDQYGKGKHIIDSWLLDISEIEKTGRKSTRYKNIVDDLIEYASALKDKLIKKGHDKDTCNKFAKGMGRKYDKLQDEHTTEAKTTTEIIVDVTKIKE